jgi:hypothetical protein
MDSTVAGNPEMTKKKDPAGVVDLVTTKNVAAQW